MISSFTSLSPLRLSFFLACGLLALPAARASTEAETDKEPWIERVYSESFRHTVDGGVGCGAASSLFQTTPSYSDMSGGSGSVTYYLDGCEVPGAGYTWRAMSTNWPAPPADGSWTETFSNGQQVQTGQGPQPSFLSVHCDIIDTIYPGGLAYDDWDRYATS